MWFRSLRNSLKSRPPATGDQQTSNRPTSRLQVEALEDRSVPAAISDPVGDFLPTYTGPQDPGLDVVTHEAVVLEDQGRVVFSGTMAGSIAATQTIGGVYVIGVNRGQGTPRFLSAPVAPPVIGPNVVWDSTVRFTATGTANFNNILAGVVTPLNPADIHINGNEFSVSVPLSLMTPAAARPPQEWTYNLWPRNGLGLNVQVADLAPDDGNSPVQTVAPARVESVVVNDGSAQRSMVNALTVTFDGPVTIDTGALELRKQDGTLVDLNVAISLVNGRTTAVLTFTGPDIVGGSLADGSYTLTIRAELIQDRFGRALDGDADGVAGGDRTDGVVRLFGDSDGDGDVDQMDRDVFRSAFGTTTAEAGYLWYFDVDADGDVDGHDNGEFNRRFGQH